MDCRVVESQVRTDWPYLRREEYIGLQSSELFILSAADSNRKVPRDWGIFPGINY